MPSAVTAEETRYKDAKEAKEANEVKDEEAGYKCRLLSLKERSAMARLTRGGFVPAEDAEFAGGFADLG